MRKIKRPDVPKNTKELLIAVLKINMRPKFKEEVIGYFSKPMYYVTAGKELKFEDLVKSKQKNP